MKIFLIVLVNLLSLGFSTFWAVGFFESGTWFLSVMFAGFVVFDAWYISRSWPWPKQPEDHDKTEDLKKVWRDKN